MSADGRYEDAKFMPRIYVALPVLPAWRACMPKVRNAQFGYPDMSQVNNRVGVSHHGYELYYHESEFNKLKAELNEVKTALEQANGRTEPQSS